MRKIVIPVVALLVVGLTAAAALAGSPHLKKGSSISCTIGSSGAFANDQVTCTGTGGMAGLGNADVKFILSGTGDATYFCVNPSGANEPKGQNKVPTTIEPASETVPGDSLKNGNLTFFGPGGNTLGPITQTPVNATGKQAGCPSDNWSTRVDAVFWTSVTVTVEQPPGTPILTCTKSDPAGLTGTFTLICS